MSLTRRALVSGCMAGGVLAPLWPVLARDGDASRAYPEEFLSLDAHTKGALGPGATIDAGTLPHVAHLLDPARRRQVAELGRRFTVVPSETQLHRLGPWEYVEATLRHSGQARFDTKGNVVTTDGRPWIGGHPFPKGETALQVFAGHTLSWGRHDASVYCVREEDIDADGVPTYRYESAWAELASVGRVAHPPTPYLPGGEDLLRYQSVAFLSPRDARGTSFLNIWPYDQTLFPDLYGYLPAFKRVRRYPTNQRFEPLIAGSTLYLSDAWAAGDPFLTWGNYRIVHRGPALAALSANFTGAEDWRHGTHGGAKGATFWDTAIELIPEAIVIETEPTAFPRAPVSKKRVWFDARTLLPFAMVSYDRRGEPFRAFDAAYALYEGTAGTVMDGAHPYWSWTHVHAHDIQTDRITRLEQVKSLPGGHRMMVNEEGIFDRYLTRDALMRLGR